jgi:hypothetical protein
VPGAAL